MRDVDSSGWIEYFTQGENADLFIPPIRDLEHLIVPTICTYDVLKRLMAGRDEDSALLAVGSCHGARGGTGSESGAGSRPNLPHASA